MASFYVAVYEDSFTATGRAKVADGTVVDAFPQSQFQRNPSGNAPSPGSPTATGTTVAGVVTLTGLTLATKYWLRCQLPTGEQRWAPYPGAGAGASAGDPFVITMPTPATVAATGPTVPSAAILSNAFGQAISTGSAPTTFNQWNPLTWADSPFTWDSSNFGWNCSKAGIVRFSVLCNLLDSGAGNFPYNVQMVMTPTGGTVLGRAATALIPQASDPTTFSMVGLWNNPGGQTLYIVLGSPSNAGNTVTFGAPTEGRMSYCVEYLGSS